MKQKLFAGGALAASMAVAALAFAHASPPAPNTTEIVMKQMGPMAGGPDMMFAMHGPMMGMGMMGGKHIEGHLAFLKTELKIKSSQEQAWNAFADAMRAHAKRAGDMKGGMHQHDAQSNVSAPDRMKMHIDMMQMHLDSMKSHQVAVAKLYAALDGTQKKTADELFGGGQHHLMMMHH